MPRADSVSSPKKRISAKGKKISTEEIYYIVLKWKTSKFMLKDDNGDIRVEETDKIPLNNENCNPEAFCGKITSALPTKLWCWMIPWLIQECLEKKSIYDNIPYYYRAEL